MNTLPAAAWTARADLAALVAALGAHNLRWVGGAVRDTLLGLPVKDIDAATPLEPAQVIAALNTAGIRSVPTGIDHGTITALCAAGPVEITTLRRDVATDGRRATVAFAQDWRDDAARRDFTINALYAHPVTLEISDYFGGLGDLAARRVRFIGDARARIREDHLRILRYYRFQARFGSVLDDDGEAACAELAPMLKGLSRERVAMELLSLLGLPDPGATVLRMAANGVLAVVLPEAAASPLAALIAIEASEGASPDALRRLSAILPPDPKLADGVAARLRLSTAQRKRLAVLAGRMILPQGGRGTAAEGGGGGASSTPATSHKPLHHPALRAVYPERLAYQPVEGDGPPPPLGEDHHALAYREGLENARDLLLLAGRSIAPLADWSAPVFPLKGGAIVARGVAAGPEVARILKTVEARWVAEGFPAAERVAEMLDEELRD